MATGSFELQAAVFERLSADSTIQTLLGNPARIYDVAPQNAEYPLLLIGGDDIRERGTDQSADLEHRISFTMWSDVAGRREVKAVFSRLHDLLHDQPLNAASRTIVSLRFISERTILDRRRAPDDKPLITGLARYRALSEPAS